MFRQCKSGRFASTFNEFLRNIGNELSKYFSKVVNKNFSNVINSISFPKRFENSEVVKILTNSKNDKVAGHDKVTIKLIKLYIIEIIVI